MAFADLINLRLRISGRSYLNFDTKAKEVLAYVSIMA